MGTVHENKPLDFVWIGNLRPTARKDLRVVSGYSRTFINRPATIAAGLVVAALGCTPVEVVDRPLLDALQPPTVLTEGRKLRLPNTGPGNRFVSGWRFEDTSRGLTIEPTAAGTRVEVVQMRPRLRTLTLSTRGDASGLAVSAAIGSRQVDVQTSESTIEIQIPADLTQGRHLLDLEFADPVGAGSSVGPCQTRNDRGASTSPATTSCTNRGR